MVNNYNGQEDSNNIISFNKNPFFEKYIYNSDISKKEILALKKWFKQNPNQLVQIYHGTAVKFPINKEGLLPTSKIRRNSYQSSSGFSCFSIFPDHAYNFAKIAFPFQPITVYKVIVPIRLLKPDLDQLRNKQIYTSYEIGKTLTDSLIHGFGFRIKGSIPPYMISNLLQE